MVSVTSFETQNTRHDFALLEQLNLALEDIVNDAHTETLRELAFEALHKVQLTVAEMAR